MAAALAAQLLDPTTVLHGIPGYAGGQALVASHSQIPILLMDEQIATDFANWQDALRYIVTRKSADSPSCGGESRGEGM